MEVFWNATLFTNDYNFNPNNGQFAPSDIYNLIQFTPVTAPGSTPTTVDGLFNTGLNGSIVIENITELLRDAVSANPFNNRPLDSSSNGVTTGFLAKDLIFIPSDGISITLQVLIDNEAFPSTGARNNIGAAILDSNAPGLPGNLVLDVSAVTLSQTTANLGTGQTDAQGASVSQTGQTTATNSVFGTKANTTVTSITRTVTAPLLLVLV